MVFVLLLCLLASCSGTPDTTTSDQKQNNLKGEYIYRTHDEYHYTAVMPDKVVPQPYPWEKGAVGGLPAVTKEYFRCKGSSMNPVRVVQQGGETVRYYDCGGAEKHSLPLRDSKEFVYPILVDLLNHIQTKTKKRVVITSGHRCPEHNTYVNSDKSNQCSKHMIGAEASFYVQGMEEKPEVVIKIIQDYYKTSPKYKGKKDFEEFQRYEKPDTNVSTFPWYNKEIFIKLFKKKEGRDFDNRHPYPYISIQVRFDVDKGEKVLYTWDKASRNYLRW